MSAQPGPVTQELEYVKSLEQALMKHGLQGILETVKADFRSAPVINSKYYAEHLKELNPALTELEQAKRDFGLKTAQALAETALELQMPVSSARREEQAEELIRLAEWFRTANGYGNYILFMRAENLSAVPLAYLVADLDFPLKKTRGWLSRIASPKDQREFRKSVLNREAPQAFIGELTGADSDQDEQMMMAWNQKRNEVSSWFKSNGVKERTRSKLPTELAFFFSEGQSGQRTTVELWELNYHHALAYGTRDNHLDSVTKLAKYREMVGDFPTSPPKSWNPQYTPSPVKAAFESAWEPYRREHGPLYDTASRVYEEVKAGTFMDWETQYDKEKARGNAMP